MSEPEEEPPEEGGVLERRLRALASVIAPTTAVGALLFYFGYVSSRAEYEYFGVDVDTIGLGTQDYVMRSPQPLLVPLLVLTLIGISALLIHARTLRRIETAAAPKDARDPGEPEHELARLTRTARRNRDIGLAVLGIGIAMLFLYALVGSWMLYALATPLLIATGAILAAYYAHVLDLTKQRAAHPRPTTRRKKRAPTAPYAVPLRAATVLLYVVIAASVFWATATVAQWTGRGLARHQAHDLDRLPT
ncbi:MAG: hypothetical protein HOV83_30320, partial [Catenulispora sp.]|nr:hypothetical protein [Catenulispora sp.]